MIANDADHNRKGNTTMAKNTTPVTETDEVTETGEPIAAHIVKTKRGENAAAVVLEARVMGTPIKALCGFVWVPSRDPKQLPVCEKCKGVYEMYKAFNDGLRDTPED